MSKKILFKVGLVSVLLTLSLIVFLVVRAAIGHSLGIPYWGSVLITLFGVSFPLIFIQFLSMDAYRPGESIINGYRVAVLVIIATICLSLSIFAIMAPFYEQSKPDIENFFAGAMAFTLIFVVAMEWLSFRLWVSRYYDQIFNN